MAKRREFITASGLTAVSLLVAGCSGDGGTSDDEGGGPQSTEKATGTPGRSTATPRASSATPDGGSTGSGSLVVEGTSFGIHRELSGGGEGWEPVDRNTFERSLENEVAFLMLSAGPLATNSEGHYEVKMEWAIRQNGSTVHSDTDSATIESELPNDTLPTVQFALRLDDLSPGDYSIEATLVDQVADGRVVRNASFTVE